MFPVLVQSNFEVRLHKEGLAFFDEKYIFFVSQRFAKSMLTIF